MPNFNLEKDTAYVKKFILEKRNLPEITAEVVLDLDVSGSTKTLYQLGTMQEAVQRVVPVALNFDDNGELPVYVFNADDSYAQVTPILTAKNYFDYVERHILRGNLTLWGGTDYAPVLRQNLRDVGLLSNAVVQKAEQPKKGLWSSLTSKFTEAVEQHTPESIREKSTSGFPLIIQFLTDGENSDKRETRDVLASCVSKNASVYFNFVGVGFASFSFLREIADEYPNTGFANIKDIQRTASSEDIYQYLIPEELTDWLSQYVRA